jgi:hypothetical protein
MNGKCNSCKQEPVVGRIEIHADADFVKKINVKKKLHIILLCERCFREMIPVINDQLKKNKT